MLNIYVANNERFIFFGDIHGLFKEFVFFLINQCQIENINIVICGDFGVGFYKINFYKTLFQKLNRKLTKKNIHIYAFRGNHDDPEYFSDGGLKTIVLDGVTNIHLIDDYDFIVNDNNTILCIGGARSVDKTDRHKWDKKLQKEVYDGWWEGEMIKDIPEGFNEFIAENNINIDIVCSHSSPDFCEPLSKSGLEFWAKHDETVIEDCDKERALLTSIYNKLKETNNIQYWFYGHFHAHYYLIKDDVVFRGLNMFDGVYKTDYYILGDGSAFS
jgi:DNA repair exonuclease SbcCD nuclease subunit